ncbi:MAG: IS21 family transposase [Deltaproteobacteria bacterium]|nr:IS21 family transposase [Deltaproteobacteria bacterium]
MATERLTMLNIREILRQKWMLERSHREVAASIGRSPGMVGQTMIRAKAAGLDWAAVEKLGDLELETKLYGPRAAAGESRPMPDAAWLHDELHRDGVTLELLHMEYLAKEPQGYRYTQFCKHYRDWVDGQRISMRQIHKGGEKTFVDFSGKRPSITDRLTGEKIPVELFVAVLGASSYTYAEATRSQKLTDWLSAHVHALEFFEGATTALVPDQLRSAVTVPCRYEPEINRSYLELSQHYGMVVLPARPRKPKDKAKVETAVRLAQRWILAVIRNEIFYSLAELNTRIRELLVVFNERPMRYYGNESRRERYLRLDKPHLKPLPATRFDLCEWRVCKPNIDYHVEVEKHFYSVLYTLRHHQLDVRIGTATVEVYLHGERVAAHKRSFEPYQFTTIKEHMPKAHQAHADYSPSRVIAWGKAIGPKTGELFEKILAERPHPEQGFRACMGILRLAKKGGYEKERLEAACTRALALGLRSRRQIESVLKRGLDKMPLPKTFDTQPTKQLVHENVRGAAYYDDEEIPSC